MSIKLDDYLAKEPEIIFKWNDNELGAEGWLVINSLRGGASGGGTRMRKGLSYEEVKALAKVMEVKFSVCGPQIGGAKSGINFDPSSPLKQEVLKRWFAAVKPILKTYYGTGGDLNVDEIKDVFPITESLDIVHPQEGVLNGHFKLNHDEKIKRLNTLNEGCKLIINDPRYAPIGKAKFTIADMITGWGVAKATEEAYIQILNTPIDGTRAIIQGWGNVAAATGFYLTQMGVKIVAIQDRLGGLIANDGFSFDEIVNLIESRDGNALNSPNLIPTDQLSEKLFSLHADIFIPGAASRLITMADAVKWVNSGLKLMACGANVPFDEDQIIYGPIAKYLDNHLCLVPDFVANCGMARVFNYLMQENPDIRIESIYQDVAELLKDTIKQVSIEGPSKGIFSRFLDHYM